MRTLKRQRRIWSKDEKLAILAEALDSSISNVARKYSIRPSLLFGWRKEFQKTDKNLPNSVNKSKTEANSSSLEREYRKLAKIQASLSAKLKRDLANDAITAYNAGNTLISLYNGMSKLESLRNEVANTPRLEQSEPLDAESQEKSAELERAAEQLLSLYARELYDKQ